MQHWETMILFFFIAFVYASVGFGGGSSYLAVLALYGLPFKELRLIALICNIIVVTGGTVLFIRHNYVNWKKIIPLVMVSVPLAFLGASLKIEQQTFFILLGVSLVVAAGLMWSGSKSYLVKESLAIAAHPNYFRDGALGGSIGFLSGMLGIGGGIFLAPVLNLAKWDSPKRIAATASIFILVNSVAGIAGQLAQLPASINYMQIALLCLAVFIGGQLGSRMAVIKFNHWWFVA